MTVRRTIVMAAVYTSIAIAVLYDAIENAYRAVFRRPQHPNQSNRARRE